MSLSIRLKTTGAKEAAASLRKVAGDLSQPPHQVLAALSPTVGAWFKESITSQGGRLGTSWPALRPSTVKERQRLGFGSGPPLRRTGELLSSIRVAINANYLRVESDHPGAVPLQKRFPFWGFTPSDADVIAERLALFYLGGAV
jgi:hypothetical protein